MTRLEMIREYVFDIASYTLEALDEIVKLINIDNNWSEEKYISFDVYKAETLRPGASAMGQPPGSDDGRLTTKERLKGENMRAQNMTIDINKLNSGQLEQLRAMFFDLNDADACKQINDRLAFIRGWMSEKKEKEYREKYC